MLELNLTSKIKSTNGVNGRELAKALNISYSMARKYITGQSLPENKTLKTLAAWLQVDPWWLLYGNKPTTSIKNTIDTDLMLSIFEHMTKLFTHNNLNQEKFIGLIKNALSIYDSISQIEGPLEVKNKAITLMVEFLQKKS